MKGTAQPIQPMAPLSPPPLATRRAVHRRAACHLQRLEMPEAATVARAKRPPQLSARLRLPLEALRHPRRPLSRT